MIPRLIFSYAKLIRVSTRVLILLFFCIFEFIIVSSIGFGADESSLRPEKYALLIGINDYKSSNMNSLIGAENDVLLIKDILIQRFQYPPEHIETIINKQATHTQIEKKFKELYEKIKPGDLVYIHYSGHGSETPDLNGDEADRRGIDSTWVSYGSRSLQKSKVPKSKNNEKGSSLESTSNLDDYDVLDDEIGAWLDKLAEKTDQIILVSDCCHSGTITRSAEAMQTRGVPIDLRQHPMGNMPVSKKKPAGVRISACRDEEKATEYRPGEKVNGMFTWFWSQALEKAGPRDTWEDIFRRTSARLEPEGGTQHPQLEGQKNRLVFGGFFPERPKTVTVTKVMQEGAKVIIDAGLLLGVTPGSVYRKYDPNLSPEKLPTVEIQTVEATRSEGKPNGILAVGDQLILESYAAAATPIRVMVSADLKTDQVLTTKVKEVVKNIPAFQLVETVKECDLILKVLRPKKDPQGNYLYPQAHASLPQSFPEEEAECWVLTNEERLYQNQESLKTKIEKEGLKRLSENLFKLARIENLLKLTSGSGQEYLIGLEVTVWRPATKDDLDRARANPADLCKANDGIWRKVRSYPTRELETIDLKTNQMLSFGVHNKSSQGYYVYLINITEDGGILPFFPTSDMSSEYAFVPAGRSHAITEVNMVMDKPGREHIRLIASEKPIDIYVLQQERYRTRGGKPLNPLEALLSEKAALKTRGGEKTFSAKEWSTALASFNIGP